MNLIPSPLHPAVTHFPIVLLLLGAVGAVGALFWRKHYLPEFAGILLLLGALGTWAAVETGESDGGLLENTSPRMDALVDEHETWAKRTLGLSLAAAAAAAGSVLARRWPAVARGMAVAAALVSLGAAYAVYDTGHRGGTLGNRHAAGVEGATGGAATAVPGGAATRPGRAADED